MEISNNDLARILGRMEGKIDEQVNTSKRLEDGLANLEKKVTGRLDEHDERLRELEVANPKQMAETVKEHAERIQALEKGAAKAGVLSGIGSSVVIAAIIEITKNKLGL